MFFLLLSPVLALDYTPQPYFVNSTFYGKCNTVLTPIAKAIGTSNAVLPLIMSPLIVPEMNASVSGEVIMTDGCSFKVNNFQFNGLNESYWFGSFQENELNQGMLLTEVPILAAAVGNVSRTAQDAIFPLNQKTGVEVNYGGFNQFRIYTKDTNMFVAYANIPMAYTSARAQAVTKGLIAPGQTVQMNSGLGLASITVVVLFSCLAW